MKTEKIYYPAIDGLRFLAAVLVIFNHAPPIKGLEFLHHGGFLGVDLFLCISAFLIVRLLRAEYEKTGTISYGKFFIRRALRIWPLYFGYVTVVFAVYVFFGPESYRDTLGYYLAHLFMVFNLVTALQGHFSVPLTEHLWTISLEEQAYLIIPFVVGYCCRQAASFRLVCFFAAAVLAYLVMARAVFMLLEIKYVFIYATLFRADAFAVGFCAALFVERNRIERGAPWFIALGTLAVFGAEFVVGDVLQGPYQVLGYSIVAFGACAVVLGCQSERVSTSLLGSRVMQYLGKISYGVYVYHLAGIDLMKYIFADTDIPNGILFLAVLAVTILISAISYELYEKRFLHLKEKFSVVVSRAV